MLFKLIITIALLTSGQCFEWKGLQNLMQILTGDGGTNESKNKAGKDKIAVVPAAACSSYNFINYVSFRDREQCPVFSDQPYMLFAETTAETGIRVKCDTKQNNRTEQIQIMDSVKDTITLLSPFGNTTKRSEPGNCALLLFYTKSCSGSAIVAPHYNALQRQYPYLRIIAIDAFKFRNLNTEFGVEGLPTIMLFHQGRPVIKFNETTYSLNNFVKFISKHTGLKPTNRQTIFVTSEDFIGPLSSKVEREDTDYWLILAWMFILICSCYYFSKSTIYFSIIEMVKRNWRESNEAQQNEN